MSDVQNGFLLTFVAKWARIRDRYLADPIGHDVNHTRLVKLWKRSGGRCHLCGGHVPHPILELGSVNDDNAPSADHVTPRVEGGRGGRNLRLAHRWCNGRRGRRPLDQSLRQEIKAEAAGRFCGASAGVG
jgi:5-methylcytosine-specific restriction endonuclease McrA